jgi:hypothetical protein
MTTRVIMVARAATPYQLLLLRFTMQPSIIRISISIGKNNKAFISLLPPSIPKVFQVE